MNPGFDVFVSYAHVDTPQVERIRWALGAQGLRVWYDETEVAELERITKSIVSGLAHSKALVAYYSAVYATRRACQWELTAAFVAAQAADDPARRVLVVNPESDVRHIEPVELRDTKVFRAPVDENEAFRVAEQIARHVSTLDGSLGDLRPLVPRWYGRSAASANRFVGRVKDMWAMHSKLAASNASVVTGATGMSIVQLRGLGGIGKTLLAQEYALRFGATYPGGVYWLTASSDGSAERHAQMRQIAARLGVDVRNGSPEEIDAEVALELESRGGDFLWIVDDVGDDFTWDELASWMTPAPAGRVLITTRTQRFEAFGQWHDLGVLEQDEAYRLLAGHRQPADEDEAREARALVSDLGSHAQAVDVAGAALRADVGLRSYAEFRRSLADTSADELEFAAELVADRELPSGHEHSIAATLMRSIDRLADPGKDFLRIAAILAAEPIPSRLVASVMRYVDHLSPEDASRRAAGAIRDAERLSLAVLVDDGQGSRRVHTLVSRTLAFREAGADRQSAMRAATVTALTWALSEVQRPPTDDYADSVVTHARHLLTSQPDEAELDLMAWIARHHHSTGDFQSAAKMWNSTFSGCMEVLGSDHADTLGALDALALSLAKLGDTRALELHSMAYQGLCHVLGAKHTSTLVSLANLAEQLRERRRLDEARELQEEVLAGMREAVGDDHPYTLTAKNNLAGTLAAQGDVNGARRLHEQILDARRNARGDQPSTVASLINLGTLLREGGDLTGALELHEEAVAEARRTSGDTHPDTLSAINALGMTRGRSGDLAGARELHEEAYAGARRVFGSDSPQLTPYRENLKHIAARQHDRYRSRQVQGDEIEAALGPIPERFRPKHWAPPPDF
jgi:tetratricopeptide (TPR) repeat protein